MCQPAGAASGDERDDGGARQPRHTAATHVFRNALSSTMGAAVVSTVVTPLDVVKVRLQAHVCAVSSSSSSSSSSSISSSSVSSGAATTCQHPLHVDGSLDAVRKIVRADGVRGLWRGLNVTLLLAVPTTGLYFTLYEALHEQLAARWPHGGAAATALVAGACARSATATVASPLELARTSLQAGVGGGGATVTSVLRQLRRQSGVSAWWRGLAPTLLRDAPFSAIYWSAYESLKEPSRSILPQRLWSSGGGNQFGVYLGAGIGAGALAAICTVPADVIKTRRQAVGSASSALIARRIVETDGVRGLFRGALPRVAKVAPACAIMMGSYEMFRTMLGLERQARF